MYHCFYRITLFEELHTFDPFSGDSDLLKSLCVHEVIPHIILVEELVRTTLDAYFLYLYTAIPSLIKDAACSHITQFRTNESRAFTGFYMEELYDEKVLSIDIEAHTISKICSCSH